MPHMSDTGSVEGVGQAPAAQQEEERLVERLWRLQTADPPAPPADKQAWYADALRFLQACTGHWWCQHGDVTAGERVFQGHETGLPHHTARQQRRQNRNAAPNTCALSHRPSTGLAEVLRYHEQQPLVRSIWRQLASQLAACADCVNMHHACQEAYGEQFSAGTAAPLLAALRSLDCARLAAALAAAAQQVTRLRLRGSGYPLKQGRSIPRCACCVLGERDLHTPHPVPGPGFGRRPERRRAGAAAGGDDHLPV